MMKIMIPSQKMVKKNVISVISEDNYIDNNEKINDDNLITVKVCFLFNNLLLI